MNQRIEAPELFNTRGDVPGGQSKAVAIPVSPEGIYIGNGQFEDPGDTIFRVVGFEKLEDGNVRWTARAYTERIRSHGNI